MNNNLSLLTAFLAFFGAIIGSYIVSSSSESLWEKQEIHKQNRQIAEKKIALYKKAVELSQSSQKYYAYDHFFSWYNYYSENGRDCIEEKSENCIDIEIVKAATQIAENRAKLLSDFASVLYEIGLYYGPETDNAINRLAQNRAWWKDGGTSFTETVQAMARELTQSYIVSAVD